MKYSILLITLSLIAVSCGPPASFDGGSDQKQKPAIKPPTAEPLKNNAPKPALDQSTGEESLTPRDKETLLECKLKISHAGKTASFARVDSQSMNFVASKTNRFQDTYTGNEKRLLILNIEGTVAKILQIELANANTTYCLNVKVGVLMNFDLGIAKGAEFVDVFENLVSKNVNRHSI